MPRSLQFIKKILQGFNFKSEVSRLTLHDLDKEVKYETEDVLHSMWL